MQARFRRGADDKMCTVVRARAATRRVVQLLPDFSEGVIARRQPPFRTDCPRDWTPPSGHPLFAPSAGEDYQIGWCEIPQRIKELAWKCARW